MTDDAAPAMTEPDAPVRRSRSRRRWRRVLLLLIIVPVAWVILMIGGPGTFLLLATAVFLVDLFLDRRRSRARRADLRERRRRSLEQAIENGGPSDKPTARHKSPDPNEAERSLYGRRMQGLIRGAWPRGRI